jgi:hypothetical protein
VSRSPLFQGHLDHEIESPDSASLVEKYYSVKPLSNVAGHSRGTTLYWSQSRQVVNPVPFTRLVTELPGDGGRLAYVRHALTFQQQQAGQPIDVFMPQLRPRLTRFDEVLRAT